MTSCEPSLTMHVHYIHKTAYNCNARLHTDATRTGQRTLLPCTSETDIHTSAYVKGARTYVIRFLGAYVNFHMGEWNGDRPVERDSYINIMSVISLPLLWCNTNLQFKHLFWDKAQLIFLGFPNLITVANSMLSLKKN